MNHSGRARNITSQERETWIACPLVEGDKAFADWCESEAAFAGNIPDEDLFIYEQDGRYPGKLAFVHADADCLVFLAPAIGKSVPIRQVMAGLFARALDEGRARRVKRVMGVIDSMNTHHALMGQCLEALGFALRWDKYVYTRDLDGLIAGGNGPAMDYKGFEELGDDDMARAMALHHREWRDITAFRAFWRREGRYWQAACLTGRFAGFCLLNVHGREATLDHIAVCEDLRGRGLGPAMLIHTLDRARRLGAEVYIGSTERENRAMNRVFAKTGCRLLGERREYVYDMEPKGGA